MVVRKQVKSSMAKGRPEKLSVKAKGTALSIRRSRRRIMLGAEITSFTRIKLQEREAEKGSSNEIGEDAINSRHSQAFGHCGHKVSKNERGFGEQPIGKQSRIL